MAHITGAFASFTVRDLEEARGFYADVIGVQVSTALPEAGPLWLDVGSQGRALVYAKPDHQPAAFTILNLMVEDLEATVDELSARGVDFEQYPEYEQDARGIFHGPGHDIAWFRDPGGNHLSLVQLHTG
jgi:extradiol dioxygenase family protein